MTTSPLPGDFAVCTMGGPAGWLIRAGQWLNGSGFAPYEHAFVCTDLVGGRPVIVEAMPSGARKVFAARYRNILWSTGVTYLDAAQRVAITKAAEGFVGTPYSWLDYAAIAAHRLHLPGARLLKGYVASTRHLICSELVAAAYAAAGIDLCPEKGWPGYVTPGDLAELILRKR